MHFTHYLRRPEGSADDEVIKACLTTDSLGYAVKLAAFIHEHELPVSMDDSVFGVFTLYVVCPAKDLPKVNFSTYLAEEWEKGINGTV